MLLGGIGWATGGVDRLVLSESGKSLRYRLEYWRGTWGVLRESATNFIVGVGPGNFRQHYLRHKLPESSEEVADPHNLLLDAWANGGLLAVTGLLGICLTGAALVLRSRGGSVATLSVGESTQQSPHSERTEERAGSSSSQSESSQVVINGFVLGGVLAFLGAYVTEGAPVDSPLPALAVGWGVAIALCSKLFRETELSPGLFGAAAIALIIHLLGAGGLGMPAITQTLLVLVALGYADEDFAPFRSRVGLAVPVAAMTAGATVAVGVLLLAFWPVLSRERILAEGDAALSQRHSPEEAEAAYKRAEAADRWSSDPPSRLAGLAYQRSQRARKEADSEAGMEKSVGYQRTAIERDPLNSGGYSALAEWCLQYGRETRSQRWLERGAAAYEQALELYPHQAGTYSDLAQAYWLAANRPAAVRAAGKALELHEINMRAGHPDKLLPPRRIELLRQILDPKVPNPRLSAGITRFGRNGDRELASGSCGRIATELTLPRQDLEYSFQIAATVAPNLSIFTDSHKTPGRCDHRLACPAACRGSLNFSIFRNAFQRETVAS